MGRMTLGQRWGAGAATGWAAFESFGEAAHVLAGDGRIVEVNAAFARMFGGPREAFYGLRHADLCDGPGAARRTSRILRQAAAQGAWQGTLESRGSDGRRFRTRAHVYPTWVDGRRYFVCIQEEDAGTPFRAGARPRAAVHGRSLGSSG